MLSTTTSRVDVPSVFATPVANAATLKFTVVTPLRSTEARARKFLGGAVVLSVAGDAGGVNICAALVVDVAEGVGLSFTAVIVVVVVSGIAVVVANVVVEMAASPVVVVVVTAAEVVVVVVVLVVLLLVVVVVVVVVAGAAVVTGGGGGLGGGGLGARGGDTGHGSTQVYMTVRVRSLFVSPGPPL